jgi:nicotinate phosphoribosyltransferase
MKRASGGMRDGDNLLLTDYYQLAMFQVYVERGLTDKACFELFVRKLPPGRNFLVAAGLEQAVEFLETARFDKEGLDWLREHGGLSDKALEALAAFRFTGDVDALPEGTVFFANEPILRVTAPLPQAQLVESRLINLLHLQTVVASKAARLVLAARHRSLVDFGLRRAHGAEAGMLAARASYIAGFAGTATALAAMRFGIPVVGTMAHSFIQAHGGETEAFRNFARSPACCTEEEEAKESPVPRC